MLTSAQFDALTTPILDLYEQLNQSVINDIARRLGNMSFDSAAWQMQRLTESGQVYEFIVKQLALMTGKSESELRDIFSKAGVKAMHFDDGLYRQAGLNPLPLNMSPAMIDVLKAGLNKTMGAVKNMTLTTAISGQDAFIDASTLAHLQITSGAMSYDQAIKAAVKGVAAKGLDVINYANGHKDQLDVAVRRTVLTGVGQTTAQLQLTRADEMGQDLIQMSAHAGARPTHQVWQGRIFSISGTSKEYLPFVESTGYGTVTGYAGVNCRHSAYPWYESISEAAYSVAELHELADKKVTYQGEQISQYDASQLQRGIERKIRYWKRQAGALESAGLDSSVETAKVRQWQAAMRGFIAQTKLNRQRVREQVV
jgi:hypothetical protein